MIPWGLETIILLILHRLFTTTSTACVLRYYKIKISDTHGINNCNFILEENNYA